MSESNKACNFTIVYKILREFFQILYEVKICLNWVSPFKWELQLEN